MEDRDHDRDVQRLGQATLAKLAEFSPDAMVVFDRHGRIMWANAQTERTFGYAREELIGRPVEVLIPEPSFGRRKDGGEIPVDAVLTPVDGDGEPLTLAVIRGEILARQRAEEALRQSEEQYRLVVETATDAVVSIAETGQILYVNPATARIFGYPASELIGRPLTMLMPEFMRQRHEAGFGRYLETGRRHINWQGTELIGRRKGGEAFPIEISFGEFVRNDQRIFTGFIRDISQQKQAEEMRGAEARRSLVRADVSVALARKEGLREILQGCAESVVLHLDAALASIWTLDQDHDVLELQASAGMGTQLDGPQSRVPVEHAKIGLIARERKPFLTNDVLNDPRISDTTWAKSEGLVAFAGYPLMFGNHTVGVIAMFSRRPLTTSTLDALASVADSLAQGIDLKRAEAALHETQAELAHVTRLTTMGVMAASIAHEVNQPLAAIVTNANACLLWLHRAQPDLEEVKTAVQEIGRDGHRASEVIARIRALVKKTDGERAALNINDIVRDVLAAIRLEVARHRIVLRTWLSEANLPSVRGDRVQLQQVVLNLVMNAIEAMREVQHRPRDLVIQSERSEIADGPGVLVAVEDAGDGFAAADAKRLFEAFYTTKREGLGMGLSISRSIIEAHGGRLSAAPRAGGGATFTFVLPTTGEP